VKIVRDRFGIPHIFEWRKMETDMATIQVRGKDAVTFVTRWTAHGPVVSDLTPGGGSVMSLRWAVLEADLSQSVAGFRRMMRATSWDQWRAAAMKLQGSPKNFVYADRDGNIGCMTTGRLPLREPGRGHFPGPGWDGTNEWQGFVPPEELPYAVNPPKGFVASCNGKSFPDNYIHERLLNGAWAHPYRLWRVHEWMASKARLDVQDMKAMQLDCRSTLAPRFLEMALPALQQSNDKEVRWAALQLKNWDYRMAKGTLQPLLYHALVVKTAWNTFADELGPALARRYLDDQYLYQERLRNLLESDSPWIRETMAGGEQTRGDLFRRSMEQALAMLELKKITEAVLTLQPM
jgi:penicillin amidase